jgi:tetratricopeptide (TPR) repeat protein
LDLLDISAAVPSLRGSLELSSTPSGDEAVRRQAQALWRSLNASPEDALNNAQRLEALDSQMRTSLEQSKRQVQDIATLSAELQAAQRARYLNPLTLFLGVLSLAALAMCFVLWRRSAGQGQPWWGSASGKAEPKDEQHLWQHLGDGTGNSIPVSKTNKTASGMQSNVGMPGKQERSAGVAGDPFSRATSLTEKEAPVSLRFTEKAPDTLDFKPPTDKLNGSTAKIQPLGLSAGTGRGGSMGRVDNTPPPSLSASSAGRGSADAKRGFAQSDFAPSAFASSRLVAAEELFDIQEQADFFLSLDQPDQAIEVLKNHITENVETSALAYVDLFDIYHRTGRKPDYAELREEFNRVFNAQVPEFEQYGAHSNGLEDFPDVLHPIQAVWSRPQQAQDVIEESIFRQPEQDQHPLDLLAYRELMLLYSLAKELARPGAAYSMLPSSMQTAVLPSLALTPNESPDVDLGDGLMLSSPDIDMLAKNDDTMSLPHPLITPATSPGSPDDGLDFDLSDSAELPQFKLPGAARKS